MNARCLAWLSSPLAQRLRSGRPTYLEFRAQLPCVRTPHVANARRLESVVLNVVQRRLALSPLGIHAELRFKGDWVLVRVPWFSIAKWSPYAQS